MAAVIDHQDWLDSLLSERFDPSVTPAISASLSDADNTLAVSCVGRRRADRDDRFELTDPMHIGSCTKALTATLVGMAAESGVLDWDQPITELAPGRCDPRFESVTLRDVCAHQAGLPPLEEDHQIAELPPLRGDPVEQRRALTAILLEQGPVSPIGEHRYSNGGFAVATALLEVATGWVWEDRMSALFDRLEMDAGLGWPRHVWGHEGTDLVPVDPEGEYQLEAWLRPAGDAHATAAAMARWLRENLAGLSGSGETVLSPDSWRLIHSPVREGPGLGWGLQSLNGHDLSVHTGSADTFFAIAVIDHDHRIGININCNAYSEAAEHLLVGLLKAALEHFE